MVRHDFVSQTMESIADAAVDVDALGTDDICDAPPPPPSRLFERLRQISGYTWDETCPPIHSTYDFWHVLGTYFAPPPTSTVTQSQNLSSPGSVSKFRTAAVSENGANTPSNSQDSDPFLSPLPHTASSVSVRSGDQSYVEVPVLARVSFHNVREERAFQIAKSVTATADPSGDHVVMPLDIVRLNPAAGERGVMTVTIYQYPGHNYLCDFLDMGPAFYKAQKTGDLYHAFRVPNPRLNPPIDLQHFLDFAIGASECLEILHHGRDMIHGEIRGDAFHYNAKENKIRIMSFGSGVRSFEHGLTSSGWSALSKELGVKNKLLYVSPEQTGRLPAEPDSRTDIYSLGVLFWMLLTQRPIFSGETAFDVVQGVLGRKIPNVSTVRIDVPDAIGKIIQKCTAKHVADRYQSASGLRYDLMEVQKALGDGNLDGLRNLAIGSRDVSSFFLLPTVMIGREKEKKEILKVIDRLARSHTVYKRDPNRILDSFSSPSEHPSLDDISTSGASSADGTTRRSGSFTQTSSSEARQFKGSPRYSVLSDNQTLSETISITQSFNTMPVPRITRRWERHQSISADVSSAIDSIGSDGTRHTTIDSGASVLSRHLGTVKYRSRGHCEVVTISGAGGLGKSLLVQSILPEARRRGYCVTAKFDTARRVPFGPIIKLLSSLIKQVWGERNTETPFHQQLKQYIRPVWPMLHRVLGLPEFLLGPIDHTLSRSISINHSSAFKNNGKSFRKRRGSSPGISPAPSARTTASGTQTAHEFLRAGSSTKTMRFVNTFLDVIRMFTHHKIICFCLEDLHFADNESLDLISQIIGARMKMVMILTYRSDELSEEKMRSVICPPEVEELPGKSCPVVTKISLLPLTETETVEYVAETLSRPKEEVLSLGLIVQSKAAGNPFYMREMLSASHRKRCIWYNYRDSKWHYDLDRLLNQFRGTDDYDILGTSFVTRRLAELPPAARAVLAWAALLGSSFSFEIICHLMSGEFEYEDDETSNTCTSDVPTIFSEADAIIGLHATLQAYIIVPGDTDDRFRFAHDRYIHASAALKECNSSRMHFAISQTLLKHYAVEARQMENTALHVCKAKDIIKERVSNRKEFRKLLVDCAQTATENGARPTAATYYSTAIFLLQDDSWADGTDDVSYEETIQLYFRAAECNLFMGALPTANDLLTVIFANAKSSIDRAPAFILQSRIFAQNGNSLAALISLKECLSILSVKVDADPTFEKCDARFQKLVVKIQSMDRSALINHPKSEDPNIASVGAVLAESTSAAWWSNCLQYYDLTLTTLEMHFERGTCPQSGMAFLNLAIVALSRFSMTQFAVEMGTVSQDMLYAARDAFSMARGQMIHACFVGHVHCSMALSVSQTEDAIELASVGGDRMSTILSYGISAQIRFLASENLADLEAYCQYACEEIPNWHRDTRGGCLMISTRQTCRALQGKTRTDDALAVLSDDQHDSVQYKNWIMAQTLDNSRATMFYESMELIVLFLYGHYDRAVEIGTICHANLEILWSARNSRLILLFYGLSRAGQLFQWMHDPRSQTTDYSEQILQVVNELGVFVTMLMQWATVSEVNYCCWSRLLEAQMAELSNQHGRAVQHYEEALDQATEHNFLFEEALGNYLMAGFFLRRKARRSARSALLEAVGLFRQLAASGIARAIEEEHSLLLHGPTRSQQTVDIGIQTDFVAGAVPATFRPADGDDGDELTHVTSHTMTEPKGDRIGAWRGSMNMQSEDWSGLPTLDMIDLHAILASSQVISSVLQVDELLKTMCNVILKTCGGAATLAAIVVQDPDSSDSKNESWCIAASGDPENGASTHQPGLPLAGTSLIADNVVLYCTRFMEPVLIPDLISDERAANMNEIWLQRNPHGKSIIAIPITHGNKPLLGVLYMEGEPRTFTDRNVTVLQLLVNQIGISYSNAMSMKRVERVSAENRSMVTVQKQALAKALESETKAKNAEAKAKRNVKLAEEAARAKAIFLANVSHELRTPLNGVIGNSELLRDSALNKEQTEMADSIRVSADLLLTVINDILDFSKMEADKMKLHMIAFNPEELVREVVRAVSYSNREKTTKKNVKIVHDINLPSALMFGDPIRLHQVLGNLIGNSLKFTEQGSIIIGAKLESETDKVATLTFWVRDTGIGIPPRQLAKLFQPFSQADSGTARKYGGSGLGLSICKSLIETMMKGKIQLESEANVGTTAWFTVSFEKADADVSAGDLQSKPTPLSDQHSAKSMFERKGSLNAYMDLSQIPKEEIRICIAEDNPINQKIAIQYVQRLGYSNVVAYENGMKAVEGLRQKATDGQPYHIILMDVMMPVLDGYEATKLIRKDPIEDVRKILVIAMTASAIQGDREKCLAAGMNDYLAKPVRSDVLRRKLEAYVGVEGPASHENGGLQSRRTVEILDTRFKQHPTRPSPTPVQTLTSEPNPSPGVRVMDPMEEGATFNQPLMPEAYLAAESPTLSVERSDWITPVITDRTLSPDESPTPRAAEVEVDPLTQQLSSVSVSSAASAASTASTTTSIKRQQRKLTKTRQNSNGSADGSGSSIGRHIPKSNEATSEKPRSVLTKKSPQQETAT